MRGASITRVMLALALLAVPSTAMAQRRGRGRGRPQTPATPATPPAGGGESGSMTFGVDEANNPPAGGAAAGGTDAAGTPPAGGTDAAGAGAAPAGGGTGLEGIGGADVRAQAHPLSERIWAVQQVYALRNRRFEFTPTAGFSLNDPYVSHPGLGVGANFWITNVLAVGANFMWFQGLNGRSDVDLRVARSARLAVPVNEYQMAAALNFTYVPLYGKFLMFNRFIFHWDMYLVAGVGIQRTRPIAVIDPEIRVFDSFNTSIMFNAGIGVRVFVSRWLAITGEVRNYVYPEPLENTEIRPDRPVPVGGTPAPDTRQDPSSWIGQTRLTDNVMVQVGLSFFLPFSVTYRLQK